ncbi:MAG: hypothetical protein VB070_15080 [Clostridiaceae bacterium]|nr:hypothetical protein [Clostridiaceae bacterium]
MNRLRALVHQNTGSAPLWAAFLAIILISFSLLIYTGMTLQANYRTAQMELERAASIALDVNLKNQNVRDLQTSPSIQDVQSKLILNFFSAGFTRNAEGNWQRKKGDKILYLLEEWHLEKQGEPYVLTGNLQVSLSWGPALTVIVPFQTQVQILFLDFQ